MGRKPGSKNITAATSDGAARPNEPLTDEQEQSLFFLHKKGYQAKLAAKKTADADIKNYCKLIKSDGVYLDDIKDAIAIEADESVIEEMDAKRARQAKLRRWLGLPLGAQADMFEGSADQAFDDGKRAGLMAAARDGGHWNPGTPSYERWHDGYGAGQAVNAARIQQSKDEDALAFDAPSTAPADEELRAQ